MLFDYGGLYLLRKRGIVALKSGTSLRGVLWAQRGRYLLMRNAELLKAANEIMPLDGEIVVDKSNIAFVQLLEG